MTPPSNNPAHPPVTTIQPRRKCVNLPKERPPSPQPYPASTTDALSYNQIQRLMSPPGAQSNTEIHSTNYFGRPMWSRGLRLLQWLYHGVVTLLLPQRMDVQQMISSHTETTRCLVLLRDTENIIIIIIFHFMLPAFRLWHIGIHDLGIQPILRFSLLCISSSILSRTSSFFFFPHQQPPRTV